MQKLIVGIIIKKQCFSVIIYSMFDNLLITIYSFLYIAYHLIY